MLQNTSLLDAPLTPLVLWWDCIFLCIARIFPTEEALSDRRILQVPAPNQIPSGIVSPRAREIAWRPSPVYLQRSRLRRFMQQQGVGSFEELLQRSAADPVWF